MRIMRSKSCSPVLGQATGQRGVLLRRHPAYDFRLLAALVVRAEQEAAQVSGISASTFLPRSSVICASSRNGPFISLPTHQLVSKLLAGPREQRAADIHGRAPAGVAGDLHPD